MNRYRSPCVRRRRLLFALAQWPALALAGWAGGVRAAREPSLAPTPACPEGGAPTPRQTAGPFYTPRSPQRASLVEPGMGGRRIVLTGVVRTSNCQPLPGALLDFWQADERGDYDNAGYRLRGHVYTDAAGRYRIETIVPGQYPGRTRHIHVKLQAPGRPVLTTQLYFPGEAQNREDFLFDARLLVALAPAGDAARFDFALAG